MVPCTPCTHRYLTPRAPACARVHARVLVSRAYTRAVCSTLGRGVPAIVESAALEFPSNSPGLPSVPPVPPKQAQRTRAVARTTRIRPPARTRHARTRTTRAYAPVRPRPPVRPQARAHTHRARVRMPASRARVARSHFHAIAPCKHLDTL